MKYFQVKGAQDKDTSMYQVSDQEDIKFHWEDPDLHKDAIFQPGIDTSFFPSTFNDFEMGSVDENPSLIEEAKDNENSPLPPHPATPASGRPTQPPVSKRSRPFATRIGNVPDHVYKKFFD